MEKTIYRQIETLASVGAGAIGEIEAIMDCYGHVRLLQIEVACASTDFDLMIFDKQGAAESSINEVYRVENVNKNMVDDEFYAGGRLVFNSDTTRTEGLYAKVKNDDQENPTGPISLRLYFTTVAHAELS